VIKRKMANWGVKRAEHSNPPKPARPAADSVVLIAA